jgi:ribonucleoside-diphosphate reductase alpha chain
LGLKGVTIYRDGSRGGQVLSTGKTVLPQTLIIPQERPETTTGKTTEIKTGCGKMLVTVNFDEAGKMFEVLAQIGRSGGCSTSQSETSGRLISLALRSGLDPKEIVKQLQGIRCQSPVWCKGKQILSCADAISQVLSLYVDGVTPFAENTPMVCPDCGGILLNQSGCNSCPGCGFSQCK